MTKPQEYRSLRDAFGQFATGVTVVTAKNAAGIPIGLTANSFASVSLEPPLVSWCIDKSSARFRDLSETDFYTISVLSDKQQGISNLFAMRSWDDTAFKEIEWFEGHNGVPQISNASARFHCRAVHRYAGGDHIIIVGAVEAFDSDTQQPLVFFQGEYQTLS